MKKISIVIGTRPEGIKLAPVVLELQKCPHFQVEVCVTGQHRTMLDQVLEVFGIVPDVDLKLMQPGQTLPSLTSRALEKLDQYLEKSKPDLLLVQGDTTTVFCGALAAFYRRIPVGHVEAGLRTGDLYSPWPEEGNRKLAGALANLHFAPTETSRQNLLKENVAPSTVFVTGNTVIDALLFARKLIEQNPPRITGLPEYLQPGVASSRKMVLITGHRRENFGEGMESICRAISQLATQFPDTDFVYPVHLNPRVRKPVFEILSPVTEVQDSLKEGQNIFLIEPASYLEFVALMNRSYLILTDSGGVQEEGPSLGKPVLVMRDCTERPEAVEAGTAVLLGTQEKRLIDGVAELLTSRDSYDRMCSSRNPYGDGNSSKKIREILSEFLGCEIDQ